MNAEGMKSEQKEPVLLWEHGVHELFKCLTCGCRTAVVQAHGHFEPDATEPTYDSITVKCDACAAAWTNRLDLGRRS